MMNKEQLDAIKKGYRWWLEAENQADKNEFAECITTEDVPKLIAEVERLKRCEEKVNKIHDAITRMENQEIDGFDFGEEVLEILGRAW